MDLSDYDYDLPKELIAQKPVTKRDHSRLLVYKREDGTIIDDYFYNLDKYLNPATTLAINNSQVDKCRLKFSDKEVFIVEEIDLNTVKALVFPGKKFKSGAVVKLADGIEARVTYIDKQGVRTLQFNHSVSSSKLDKFRQTPFPPYITPNEALSDRYQTKYASQAGSKAAPTAGLHFSQQLLNQLKKSHSIAEITLHVGMGTFAPLKPENFDIGRLHAENIVLDKKAAGILSNSDHITAVGTTSLRALESIIENGKFKPKSTTTELFIQPGYKFQAVNNLITNFHLPKSSLLILVAAFIGIDEMKRIYQHAIEQQYRFYSFGDAMLL